MDFGAGLPEWQLRLLADPQTSGGLLAAVAPEQADEVLARFREAGFDYAAKIGRLAAGDARIVVR